MPLLAGRIQLTYGFNFNAKVLQGNSNTCHQKSCASQTDAAERAIGEGRVE